MQVEKRKQRFRWVVFFVVLLTYILLSGLRTASGLITDQIMEDFHLTATVAGLMTSLHFALYIGLQIPMGIWVDQYGPNRFVTTGALLAGVGTMLYSLSPVPFLLFAARFLTGIGDATIWVSMVLIIGQWFEKRQFPQLISIAAMSGSLGYLLATIPMAVLIEWLGWRKAFFSAGLGACLCGVWLVLLLSGRQGRAQVAGMAARYNPFHLFRKILIHRQAWALFCCHFGLVGTFVGFIGTWMVPFAMELYGMALPEASRLVTLGLIGAMIGAPLAGWVAKRTGTIKRPYLVVQLMFVSGWSVLLLYGGSPPVYMLDALFFVIGMGYGANALTFAAVRQSFPSREIGIASGFANTGGFLSAVLVPGLFGKVLDHFRDTGGSLNSGYPYGFAILVAFALVGLAGVLSIREDHPYRGTVGKKAET